MVEFALPKNSKITEGKAWPKPATAKNTREFRVYRWNPDDGKNPQVDTYYINTDDCGPMVLDGAVDPQHVVEEQVVAVARGEPVVGQAGFADQDAAQLPDFGVDAEAVGG